MSRKPDELEAPGSPEEIERSGLERTEARLDELAQRFDKVDWIELAAAVLLSLATIMAAWSAYQSTRWNGERARVASVASAKRVEATRATTIQETQTIIDVIRRYAASLQAVGSRFVVVTDSEQIPVQLTRTGAEDVIGPENIYQGTEWVGATLRRAYDDALDWVAANRSDDTAGDAEDDRGTDGDTTEGE